jgi:hypothetical protein
MSSHQPFRFLDLPKELRLTVYETIAITTTLHPFEVRQNTITLRIQSLPTTLLATCRVVRDEASPILGRQIQEIATQTARLELPVGGLRALMNEPGLLEALLFGIRLVRGSDTAATWELVVDVILKMQSNLWGSLMDSRK